MGYKQYKCNYYHEDFKGSQHNVSAEGSKVQLNNWTFKIKAWKVIYCVKTSVSTSCEWFIGCSLFHDLWMRVILSNVFQALKTLDRCMKCVLHPHRLHISVIQSVLRPRSSENPPVYCHSLLHLFGCYSRGKCFFLVFDYK